MERVDTVWTPDRDDDPRSQFQDARFIVGDNFDPKALLPADADLRFLGAARFIIECYENAIDEDKATSAGELHGDACTTRAHWDEYHEWVEKAESDRIVYLQRMAEIDVRLAGESPIADHQPGSGEQQAGAAQKVAGDRDIFDSLISDETRAKAAAGWKRREQERAKGKAKDKGSELEL